ncbi:hypothetical protein EV379_0341 [Microterricola gilva]|uniref:DUF6458 domain-containing protein n=1 Tax=Microterricola gilva TaxID=393267 RepID=A0A4Q8AI54_9MICO|nr:DUF6458 family protein [Microterricola gilva]RZU64048.1 hypothetical protein EV379_0341 [Microterricola gilva]
MSIGLGIFLIAIGAILTFALNVTLDWIDLDLVGYILMAAGAVVTIIGIALLMRRRRSVSTTQTLSDPVRGEQTTRREDEISPEL